ncbi:hypothetical protein [Streptomyces sp. IMTB 2501]|uniref:hypothetical protein n=1 Tax=Streptomyces sp. IMTB 2501 TaxID=1776340 RepID=UPI0026990EBA|nr:hypothetical protein [Streptomyces sp. IMTB 2501]
MDRAPQSDEHVQAHLTDHGTGPLLQFLRHRRAGAPRAQVFRNVLFRAPGLKQRLGGRTALNGNDPHILVGA